MSLLDEVKDVKRAAQKNWRAMDLDTDEGFDAFYESLSEYERAECDRVLKSLESGESKSPTFVPRFTDLNVKGHRK